MHGHSSMGSPCVLSFFLSFVFSLSLSGSVCLSGSLFLSLSLSLASSPCADRNVYRVYIYIYICINTMHIEILYIHAILYIHTVHILVPSILPQQVCPKGVLTRLLRKRPAVACL